MSFVKFTVPKFTEFLICAHWKNSSMTLNMWQSTQF